MDQELLQMVCDRKLTAGEAVDILFLERWLREPWWLRYVKFILKVLFT